MKEGRIEREFTPDRSSRTLSDLRAGTVGIKEV